MHSQLMFNECIAKTRSLSLSLSLARGKGEREKEKREDSVHIIIHVNSMHCCRFSCVYAFRVGGMKVFLTYFPAADSEKESEDIRLLLLLKLFDVLEGTHLDCCE